MSYSVGNWTVSHLYTDTLTTPKTPSIADLDYAVDYTVTQRAANEVRLANITGAGLQPVETLRYARTRVADVYADTDIPESSRCNVRAGIRSLYEVRFIDKAVNSVSGQEILLPYKGWICLQAPTVDFVSAQALQDLHARTIAASYGTGEYTGTMAVAVARGDLDPTS